MDIKVKWMNLLSKVSIIEKQSTLENFKKNILKWNGLKLTKLSIIV